MSLRFSCGRQRNSQLHLQEGTGQDNEAPGFEGLDCPQLLGSRRTSHQRTIGAILRSDGKRPGGLSLVTWQSGKALCWDVTVICPLADSYISDAAREPGSVAELAASRKEAKYAVLEVTSELVTQ